MVVVPKFSALVLVDRLKRALPQTQLMVYLRSIRAVECQSLLSMGVMGLVDTSVSGVDLLQGMRKVVRRDVHLSVKVAQALALSRFCSDNPFDRLSRESSRCVIWWWTESALQTSPSSSVCQRKP
jgi:DNA-binding NarL/FixJ family response regulator